MAPIKYLDALKEETVFNRDDLLKEMRTKGYSLGEASFKNELQRMLSDDLLARAGRNAYFVMPEHLKKYSYSHSNKAKQVANLLEETHPYLTFTIFELAQLNEFLNHQIAHNILFISVSKDVGDAVMETLQSSGEWVLLNPSITMFQQYWNKSAIVINRLITESPMTGVPKWSPCLEKILVDIISDKVTLDAIPESELPGIFETAFERYVVDESTLFRYAKRRNSDGKIKKLLEEHTNVELRVK